MKVSVDPVAELLGPYLALAVYADAARPRHDLARHVVGRGGQPGVGRAPLDGL